jgi:hypothetical protein
MKRLIVAIFVLMLCFSAYSAVWTWESNYLNVTNFRYQIGGEEGHWTVVPANVTRLETADDSSQILYVQQSLDYGRSWSPSGSAEYIGLEDGLIIEETAPLAAEDAAPAAEEVEQVVATKENPDDSFRLAFVFTVAPVYERAVAGSYPFDPNAFGVEAELGFENIAGRQNASFGFDIDAGLMLIPKNALGTDWFKNMFSTADSVYRAYADIIFDLRVKVSDMHLSLGIGGGAAVLSEPGAGLMDVSGCSLVPSFAAEAKIDYAVSRYVTTGLGLKYRYDFKPDAHRVSGCYVIGVRI